jgi:hypothetical protein
LTVEVDTALVNCLGLGLPAASTICSLLLRNKKKANAARMMAASGRETPSPIASLVLELIPDDADDADDGEETDANDGADDAVALDPDDDAGGVISRTEKSLLR